MSAAVTNLPDRAVSLGRGDIPVSVVIVTKNEAANIRTCLECLTRFAEVFVVDSNSSDGTAAIAAEMGAKVVQFTWNGLYPKKKQWSLENLPFGHDWILCVDADEQLGSDVVEEISDLMRSGPKASGYFLRFDNSFLGKRLRHGIYNFKLVMFRHRESRWPDYDDLNLATKMEIELHFQPIVEGPLAVLRNRALHADFKDLHHFLDRLNRYSDWEAVVRSKGYIATGESQFASRALLKRIFHHMPGKPLAVFLYSYVYKLGFLDGRAGFAFAASRFWYYWQIGMKMRELRMKRAAAGETP